MGEKAFPTLPCPRLSHASYTKLRDRTLGLLKDRFYTKVLCPPEAPSKDDRGDIDLLVADPTHQFTADDLSGALQAVQHTKTGKTTSFAVPLTVGTEDYMGNVDPRFLDQYVQIDIHVCKSENVDWEMFHNSYGDLIQILGVMNRSIGLTANDRGLHLRLQDIEVYNKKKSLVYLSKDPKEVMAFLGLDHEMYSEQEFTSNEEIYDWCATGRLYTPPSLTRASEGGNETANDRQRDKKRPMFTICMNEYYPKHPELFANRQVYSREDVIQECLNHFPHAKPAYEAALAEHKQAMSQKHVLEQIKVTVPAENEKLAEIIRGLKRFVRYTNGQPCLAEDHKEAITERPNWIEHVNSDSTPAKFLAFVSDNWEAVRGLEQKRMADAKAERGRKGKKDSFRPSSDSDKGSEGRDLSEHSNESDIRDQNGGVETSERDSNEPPTQNQVGESIVGIVDGSCYLPGLDISILDEVRNLPEPQHHS